MSVIPTIDRIFVPNVNGMEIFVVIASDGFWDYVGDNNQFIVEIIKREREIEKIKEALKRLVVGKQRLAAFHIIFLTFLFIYCDATA